MNGAQGRDGFERLLAAFYQEPAAFQLPNRLAQVSPRGGPSKFATRRCSIASDQGRGAGACSSVTSLASSALSRASAAS
jgi:hypothetical protein